MGHGVWSKKPGVRIQNSGEKQKGTFPRETVQEAVSQFVIPAKSAGSGREPGSRKKSIMLTFHWIPDLAPRCGARSE